MELFNWDDGSKKSIFQIENEIEYKSRGYYWNGQWYPCSNDLQHLP